MDLSKIKAVETVRVEISHPACEGVAFVLAGATHPATKKAEQKRADALLKAKRGLKADDRERMMVEFIAARVLSWEGVEWDGKPLECTPENVEMVLTVPDLAFLRDEILVALGDDEAFFTA